MSDFLKNPISYNPMADVLECARPTSNRFEQVYGKGVVVGLVAGVMAMGNIGYEKAIYTIISQVLTKRTKLDPACVPDGWEEALAPITGKKL